MSQLQALKALLDGVSPLLAPMLLVLGTWGAMWIVRRFAPSLWEKIANIPFGGDLTLATELERIDVIMRKAWQAVPSAMLGAFLVAQSGGGSTKEAFIGAAFGLLAPALHELLKWSPLPYGGKRK